MILSAFAENNACDLYEHIGGKQVNKRVTNIAGIDLRLCIEHNKASFGYVLNREYWNKGYMSEALSLIRDLSFSKLELKKIFRIFFNYMTAHQNVQGVMGGMKMSIWNG